MVIFGFTLSLAMGLVVDPSPQSFERWWAESLQASQRLDRLNGLHIEWTQAVTLPMPEGGIQGLRELVSNKPDHPGRYELRRLEAQERNGPEIQSFAIWRGVDGQRVRLSRTTALEGRLDAATRNDGAWIMTDRSLTLFPSRPTDERRSVAGTIAGFDPMVRSVLTGGFDTLASGGASSASPPSLGPDGQWSFTGQSETLRVRARGSFDPKSGLGSIAELTSESVRGSKTPTRTVTRMTDWRSTPLGTLPHTATISVSPSGYAFEIRLKNLAPIDDSTLDELTRDPAPERPDPARGATTFTEITDERNDGSYRSDEATRSSEPHTAGPFSAEARTTSPGLLVAGWSLAGVIGLFLAWSGWKRFKEG